MSSALRCIAAVTRLVRKEAHRWHDLELFRKWYQQGLAGGIYAAAAAISASPMHWQVRELGMTHDHHPPLVCQATKERIIRPLCTSVLFATADSPVA